MEELDRQILQLCSKLKCSFYDPTLTSLEQLSHDDVLEFLTRCLWLISPPSRAFISSCKLSPYASERFQMATALANSFLKYNVRGRFGYQTLLYGSTAELREVFIAVYEKIPKEISSHLRQFLLPLAEKFLESISVWILKFGYTMTWKNRLYRRQFHDGLDVFLIALSCGNLVLHHAGIGSSGSGYLPFRSEQVSSDHVTSSSPAMKQRIPHTNDEREHGSKVAEEPLTTAAAQVSSDRTQLLDVLDVTRKTQKNLEKVEGNIRNCRSRTDSIWRSLAVKDREAHFLMDSSTSKAELLDFFTNNATRATALEYDAQDSKRKLLRQLKGVKNSGLREKLQLHERYVKCLRKFQSIHHITKQRAAIADKKERHLKAARSSGDDTRFIVHLIKEAIGYVQKQYDETDKVHNENMAIQRELKWTTQTLHRVFSPIDEVLFEEVDDRRGECAYKLFGRLHTSCMNSMETIEQNGVISRLNVELVDMIEVGKQRQFAQQLHRIRKDLAIVSKDNEDLVHVLAERFPRNHSILSV